MNYSVIRSDRKTLSLEVTREQKVIVRAPRRCAERRIEDFVRAHEGWIARALARQRAIAEAYPEPTAEEEARLRAAAKEFLPARTDYYAGLMGLRPQGVRITSARTRFGSCSANNHICYSWRLMMYPPEAIDYVVVHELAHIPHKNHGREFYACIAKILPDYKKRRALLRAPEKEDAL